MAFTPRLTAPATTNKYFYADNPFYQSGVGIPNCTAYAFGRFWEIAGTKPNLSLSDAENWYSHNDGYKRGQTPKLGAVICLGNGPYSGLGHVAVVEQIKANGNVVFSNSAWGGAEFYIVEGNASNGYGYSEYDFQGFIYNPAVSGGTSKTWIKGNRYLCDDEMTNNAYIVCDYLTACGWTLNAIAGLLGNMESESTINPAIWQNLDSGNYNGGYGLVQWTPATNYTNWATAKGYSITDGNKQLEWIDKETVKTGQWITTELYPMTFDDFKKSTLECDYLASVFLKNFERAGVEVEDERQQQARKWFDRLAYYTPVQPGVTKEKRKKKKGYNFMLFTANKRSIRKC